MKKTTICYVTLCYVMSCYVVMLCYIMKNTVNKMYDKGIVES